MKHYFFSLHDQELIPELLNDYRKSDWLMIRLIFLHWVFVSTFSAMFYGTYLFGFIAGGILTFAGWITYHFLSGTPMFRIVAALILMSFTIISIQQSQGSIEMHFHIFVLLSFLTAYKDIRPVGAASILVIVHHLIFNYLQEHSIVLWGMPIKVFSYGCGLDIVLLHAFFVIFEWLVLIWVINRATNKFLDEVNAKHRIEVLLNETKLSSTVFEHADEGILITDENGIIISVNKAFENVTGYTEKEAIGKTPNILKSGRHDSAFFSAMWESITTEGKWKGQIWNKTKNGDIIPMWLTISIIYDHERRVRNYVSLLTDMSKIVKANEEIKYMAYHDTLTGLPNRLNFQQQLQHAIHLAKRNATKLAILFIDLDRFKVINDTLGHQIGDEMLKIVSKRINDIIRESDSLARIGGDEFLLLMENVSNENHVAIMADKITRTIKEPMQVKEHTLHISASVGISLFPDDANECAVLIKAADSAMYHSKEKGKNTFSFFTKKISEKIYRRMQLENALRSALANQEFSLVYQPYYHLRTKKIIGAEALLRWRHKELGDIEPSEFISIAEETHLINEIGAWVIEEACQNFVQWKSVYPKLEYISINISSVQVSSKTFFDEVMACVQRTGVPPSSVEFEITERLIVEQTTLNNTVLAKLRAHGFRIAVDDFGTGYSSMNYLKKLPLDTLKIDRSFITGLPDDDNDVAIIKAILALTENLHYHVVAEGIENKIQEDFLLSLSCEIGQGYLFSKPLNSDEFQDKLM